MTVHRAQRRSDRRRRWGWWVLGLMAVVLSMARCAAEKTAEPAPWPVATLEPVPLLLPPPVEPEPEPQPLDAAVELSAPLPAEDAGRPPVVNARKEPDVEDYMRRWRVALAPLFRANRFNSGPELIKAMPRGSAQPDAGVEPCKPRVQRLAFVTRPRTDLVVVIDTSGSMLLALPKISLWLAELERDIVKANSDIQLVVVAAQRELGRRAKPDAGSFNVNVGSNDSLDVLLASPKPGQLRWVDVLRSAADLHLVVVTDDEARGKGADYVARLTEVLGGARFRLHLLGGLETPNRRLLTAKEPLASATCSGEGVMGLNPGEAYQEAAQLTNGLRAPLCYEAARRELSEELLRMPSENAACGWWIDAPGLRIHRVDAVGPRRPSTGLIEERVLSNCYATRRSYRRAGPLLVLCEDTCTALKREGYDGVEVKLECGD